MIIAIKNPSEITANNDMDGVIEMQELSGQAQIRSNHFDSDLISPDQGLDWVNATGKKPMPKRKPGILKRPGSALKKLGAGLSKAAGNLGKNINATVQRRQANKTLKIKSKFGAKDKEAQAKIEQAKALGKDDKALAAALSQRPLAKASMKKASGLSTGAKIGIAVGSVAVIGLFAFAILKKK